MRALRLVHMCASSLVQDACLHPTACSAALRFMQTSSHLLMSRSGHVHSSHAHVRCRRIRASMPTSGSRFWTVSRVLTEGWIMGNMVTPRMCHRRVCCPLSFAAMHVASGARTLAPSGSCLHVCCTLRDLFAMMVSALRVVRDDLRCAVLVATACHAGVL